MMNPAITRPSGSTLNDKPRHNPPIHPEHKPHPFILSLSKDAPNP